MKRHDYINLTGILCIVAAGFFVCVPLGLSLAGVGCLIIGIGAARIHKAEAERND